MEADEYHVLKAPTVFHTVRLSGGLSSPPTTDHIVNIWLTQDTQAKTFISMIFQGQASSGKVNIFIVGSVRGLGWPEEGFLLERTGRRSFNHVHEQWRREKCDFTKPGLCRVCSCQQNHC